MLYGVPDLKWAFKYELCDSENSNLGYVITYITLSNFKVAYYA